ncbi:transcription antitermination factor NusB [Vreelandella jeotgali]|uniref:transcription antitermination factor NusB n=1 Tax=Vreelandella jeotgali TaxID=553386 RepID=UPI00034B0E6D|nr:transcription antitermination factor NusB [Halomonas jeotgali]
MSQQRQQPSDARQGRHAARELAVQGLYQWQMTGKSITAVEAEFKSQTPDDDLAPHENWAAVMNIADQALFSELLHGTAGLKGELDSHIAPVLDRRLEDLGSVELAILRLGAYEMARRPQVPYRVVINEGVELAKSLGATDAHKYVNGILDKLANRLRSAEVTARGAGR